MEKKKIPADPETLKPWYVPNREFHYNPKTYFCSRMKHIKSTTFM